MTVRIDDGWIAGLRRCESPNQCARPAGCAIDLIVLHCISLPPGEYGSGDVEALFCNRLNLDAHPEYTTLRGLEVSAHLFIDRAGVATQFVSLLRSAWHAGQSHWRGRTACNDFSIGIELEGTDTSTFTDAQYETLQALLDAMRAAFDIDPQALVGHEEIAPGRKTDPGPGFDWERVGRLPAQPA